MKQYICPKCGDFMLVTYRKDPKSDAWQWVKTCQTCRHVVKMLDSGLPVSEVKEG